MQAKKIIAVVLSLCMLGGEVSCGAPFITQSITAQAATTKKGGYSFDESTGVLTLSGNLDRSSASYFDRSKVIKIVAEAGTVFPEYSNGLFSSYSNCTYIDLSGADTSKVTDMGCMFDRLSKLTYLNISGFDTSNVTDMYGMFYECSSLTSLDLSGFNTGKVKNMHHMFCDCENLKSLDLSGFDTSKVENMRYMFSGCKNLTSLDVSSINTSKVTDMVAMFEGCSALERLDLSSFKTSNVKTDEYDYSGMKEMFSGCKALKELDISSFDTSNVTSMYRMLYGCDNLSSLDVSSFDTSNVENMYEMFSYSGLVSLDLSTFDTSNVKEMGYMFYECKKLTTIDVSGFDTSKVTNESTFHKTFSGMTYMFYGCEKLTSLDLSSFDISNLTQITGMFGECSDLTTLDLSSFDTSNIDERNISTMFYKCDKLRKLILGENFKKIPEVADLPNGKGWVNEKEPSKVISGNGDYAVIENNGKNTYIYFVPTPTNINYECSTKYHQIRFTWDPVKDAECYGIAVYLAGKWRIQANNITKTVYTTPKNLYPGYTYKVAITAKVDGEWGTENAIKNAVTVTVDVNLYQLKRAEYINIYYNDQADWTTTDYDSGKISYGSAQNWFENCLMLDSSYYDENQSTNYYQVVADWGCGLIAISDVASYLKYFDKNTDLQDFNMEDYKIYNADNDKFRYGAYMSYLMEMAKVFVVYSIESIKIGDFETPDFSLGCIAPQFPNGLYTPPITCPSYQNYLNNILSDDYVLESYRSSDNAYEKIKSSIINNIPVIMSYDNTIYNGDYELPLYIMKDNTLTSLKIDTTISSHYMTITGILEISDELVKKYSNVPSGKMLQVSSWGRKYYVDFEDYKKYIGTYTNLLIISKKK